MLDKMVFLPAGGEGLFGVHGGLSPATMAHLFDSDSTLILTQNGFLHTYTDLH
jgi:hypothetical protein